MVAQARGNCGPLFAFDVHDDVRLRSDAPLEEGETQAGEGALRRRREQNQRLFPARRWEPHDPGKRWDGCTVR